jgi:hypothetical protein
MRTHTLRMRSTQSTQSTRSATLPAVATFAGSKCRHAWRSASLIAIAIAIAIFAEGMSKVTHLKNSEQSDHHVRPQGGSAGALINTQPGFQFGIVINVVSVALDFVH